MKNLTTKSDLIERAHENCIYVMLNHLDYEWNEHDRDLYEESDCWLEYYNYQA